MNRQRVQRLVRWLGAGLAIGLLIGVVAYLLIPKRVYMDFVWRQARGTRYEQRVVVWRLKESNDPMERALAEGRIQAGDSVERVLEMDGSPEVLVLGRYHIIKERVPEGCASFGGWTILAKDGKLTSATSWSCIYTVDFFDTLTASEQAECTQLYFAERDRQRQARGTARMAVAGFGATFDPWDIPRIESDPEN